jgi:hypothetical protein
MFRVTIDASDLIAKINALGSDGQLARDIADAVADEAVIPELAKAPMRSGKRQPFRTAKQRRFFFAALKDGRIEVPYRRTGKIGISEKHATSNGVDVTVPVKYSDLVRTKKKQAKYHTGTWEDSESIARRLEGDVVEIIATAAVIEALRKAGLT